MSARLLKSSAPHPAQLRLLRHRLRLSIRDAGFTDLSAASNGTTAHDTDPQWELDPAPLILSADEWAEIETGLKQRAHLVNALLVDLYSGQQALKEKVLPPDVVLADPFYRRPCINLAPGRPTPATVLRFDLIKTAGGWMVADTHTNTPIGLSYAVQNRRFMTQEVGGLYRTLPDYHSVINFPLQLLSALRALAPRPARAPSIIVLTTGPQDPFFPEHSFLARKMGLPLARGGDLLVLDNIVYFKTIAGLEPVDVIYRRLNDAHIDPVVFSTHREFAGIPGLVQCIRAGNVVIANAIGAGVAESRALDAFLPALMRFYLGERPLLPSLPTFTCGDTDQLDYILAQPDRFDIRPAHTLHAGYARPESVEPDLLPRGELAQAVRQNPYNYVAQSRIAPLPINPLARRSPTFRLSTFVLCSGRTFAVFPGGLARIGDLRQPLNRVGLSADVIVLAPPSGADTAPDLEIAETGGAPTHTLGSRAAENLFWLGRYLERAEATARMLSILDDVALEEIPARDRRRWLPIWRGLLEATGHTREKITARAQLKGAIAEDLTWRMTLDAENSSSIYSSLVSAVENARQLRDYVSPEVWSVLTRLVDKLAHLSRQPPPKGERQNSLNASPSAAAGALGIVLTEVNAFLATSERTMLHDAGWHFLRLGGRLERAIMTCSALRHILGALDEAAARDGPDVRAQEQLLYRDNPELSAFLRMLGSQDAYRRLYQTRSQPLLVAELFLQQIEAPRSIAYNLHRIRGSLAAIHREIRREGDDPVAQAVAETLSFLGTIRLADHFSSEPATQRLSDLLAALLDKLYDLHPLLSDHYFSHQARLSAEVGQAELKL